MKFSERNPDRLVGSIKKNGTGPIKPMTPKFSFFRFDVKHEYCCTASSRRLVYQVGLVIH